MRGAYVIGSSQTNSEASEQVLTRSCRIEESQLRSEGTDRALPVRDDAREQEQEVVKEIKTVDQ